MDIAVVDTDVLSYVFKADLRAGSYQSMLAGSLRVISFMTLAELRRWALKARWGAKRRAELADFLKDFEVQYVDQDLCRRWAEVSHAAERKGRSIACADAWVAATALALDVPLVTNNAEDYSGVDGLKVLGV